MEIYKSIDLKNNELKNIVVEKKTSNEIIESELIEGKLVYDTTNKLFYGFNDSQKQPFNTGVVFNSIIVETDLNDGFLEADENNKEIKFKQGNNIFFEYDNEEKSITINADVEYSAQNFSTIFGNSDDVEYTINHGLGSSAIVVSVIINAGASVHPDLTIERYTTVDDNNVLIRFNTPPGIDTVTANINSKHGEKGLDGSTGPTGAVGPTGPTGANGTLSDLTFPAEQENSIIFINEQQLTASDGITFDGNLLALQGSDILIDNGIFEHNNSANSNNAFKITYNHTTPVPEGNKIIEIIEKSENGVEEGFYLYLTSEGNTYIKSIEEGYNNNKQSNPVFMTVNDSQGYIHGSSIDVQQGVVFKEVSGTISSESIKTSYSNPIEIIPAKAGHLIDIHNIFIKYNYNINPYTWTEKTGFIFPSSNNFLGVLYNQMIQGNKSGYQKISINATDDPLKNYYYPNEPIIFKTLTTNPSSGEGNIQYIIRYSYVVF